MTAEPGRPPWVDDVSRLFRAVRDAADGGELLATAGHAPECRACPVCRGLAAVRDTAPELLDQLAAVASGLAESLRRAAAPEPAAQPPDEPPAAAPQAWATHRIEVTD